MITIKLSQLVNAVNSGALPRLTAKELPIKTGFRLRSLIKQVNAFMKDYEDTRVDLLKKVEAVLNEQTQIWDFPSAEAEDKFKEQYLELVEADIEITGDPFKLANFLSSTTFSGADLDVLDWLIVEAEPVAEQTQVAAA